MKGLAAKIAIALAEQIEEDTGCRNFLGQQFYPRGGRMNAQLKSVEVEAAFAGDHKFTVKHTLCRKVLAKWIKHLGEVTVERLLVPALDEDLIAIPKDKYSKAVPFGFVDPFALRRHFGNALGEHGEYGRVDGEVHARGWGGRDICIEVQMPQSQHAVV